MNKKKNDIQYYTMELNKFMEIMTDNQKDYSVICSLVKEYITKYDLDQWEITGTNDIIETYVIIRSLKLILDKKLNEPTKEEIDFCTKNNISDMLLSEAELIAVQSFLKTVEYQRDILKSLHKINITVH